MARFSVGGGADESSSSPGRKRRRSHSNLYQQVLHGSIEEESNKSEQEEEEEEEDEEEENEEEDEEEEEEVGEEEEEEEGENENTHLEIAEPRSSNPAPLGPTRNGAICVTLTDPEVLDCPVCYESLSIPVFQCENGHTACSSCCRRLAHKCPSCSLPIGYNRCRAIEKVLESVKLSCQNLRYGCTEMVTYSKKSDHDKICAHLPCSCPQSGCSYVGSSRQLYQHFSNKHKGSAVRFLYGNTFPVFFTVNDKSLILQEEKEGVLFILKNRAEILGNVIVVSCIGPSSSKVGCFYEVTAKMDGSNLRFQSFTKNIQRVNDGDPHSGDFLVLPSSFFGSYGQVSLDLCIKHSGKYLCIKHSGKYPANIQTSTSTTV